MNYLGDLGGVLGPSWRLLKVPHVEQFMRYLPPQIPDK